MMIVFVICEPNLIQSLIAENDPHLFPTFD